MVKIKCHHQLCDLVWNASLVNTFVRIQSCTATDSDDNVSLPSQFRRCKPHLNICDHSEKLQTKKIRVELKRK